MQVIVMAGGRGQRIESIDSALPKALLPIGNSCLLDLLIAELKKAGATEVIICAGYLANKIQNHLNATGSTIVLIKEDEPLGTAGALGNIKHLLKHNFMVVNCDIIGNFSYSAFFSHHLNSSCFASAGIKLVDHTLNFGLVSLSPDGSIESVVEKPSWKRPVLTGIYAFQKQMVEMFLKENTRVDMPDFIKIIIEHFGPIQSFEHQGIWLDIGTPEDYKKIQELSIHA